MSAGTFSFSFGIFPIKCHSVTFTPAEIATNWLLLIGKKKMLNAALLGVEEDWESEHQPYVLFLELIFSF